MRPGTRLHPNHARRQGGEERQHRVPAQTLRHNHLALSINAVNLKHRLRQIETDERRRGIVKLAARWVACATRVGYETAMTNSSLYAGHRFPPELISYTVWLYFRFSLSLRMGTAWGRCLTARGDAGLPRH